MEEMSDKTARSLVHFFFTVAPFHLAFLPLTFLILLPQDASSYATSR